MTIAQPRSNLVPLTRIGAQVPAGSPSSPRSPVTMEPHAAQSPAPHRIRSFDDDEEDMINENASAAGVAVRDIPIDWEALEDAFENNAPEVHSYLHLVTGDVLRVVDGV